MPIPPEILQRVRAFELAVYGRDHGKAVQAFLALFRQSEVTLLGPDAARDEGLALPVYNRIAAAFSALLADPTFAIGEPLYRQLSTWSRAINALFSLTPYRNLDHVLELAGIARDASGRVDARSIQSRNQRVRFFLTRSLGSEVPLDVAEWFRINPYLAAMTCISLLTAKPTLAGPANADKVRILSTAGPFLAEFPVPADPGVLSRLASAWMLCSYLDDDRKHEVKDYLNQAVRGLLRRLGTEHIQEIPRPERKAKPTLVAVVELMTAGHAMFRCHGRDLRRLRDRFHLVLVANHKEVDHTVQALFDEVLLYEPTRLSEFPSLVRRIADRKPDLIYFPSVGMRHVTVLLANLRLAPIQLASLGHPATTHSAFVDYILVHESNLGDPACFSEKLVLLRDESLSYIMPAAAARVTPELREHPSPVRVAVPSKSFKLTASFLDLCRRIDRAAGRPVEFHFFPNESSDLFHHAVARDIHAALPAAVVHRRTGYDAYIRNLNACDLHFTTYPFGGHNSAVDSLRQALPILTREGREVHSRLDSFLMRLAGLPEWLITHSEEEYLQAALRLIGDDALRLALRRAILERDVDAVLLNEKPGPHVDDFADAVWWLYEHHEQIQTDDRKVWKPAERAAVRN